MNDRLEQRTIWTLGALSLMCFLAAGCLDNVLSPTTINTATNQPGATPSATPAPSPIPGTCAPATSLTASVIEGPDIIVGSVVTLEVTVYVAGLALDQDGPCGRAKSPIWSMFPSASVFEFTTSATGFNPSVRARAAGTGSTTVTVDGQSVTLTLRAR